mmetsp:Transcript_31731/g.83919  ORF Transcript_31731/g.83919 Transcript_31731/m.83919 type:complete len:239 (+) Transcript_31731:113-829(+)
MNWKAPISLTTKPKDAQFYARLNADDAWKHKYKAYCFSWTQGQAVSEPPREFAVLDETTVARNAAIETARRLQISQAAELQRRRLEAAQKLQAQIKQRVDEVDAVAILSGFAFVQKEGSDAGSERGTVHASSSSADSSDADDPAASCSSDDGASSTDTEAAAETRADSGHTKRKRDDSPRLAPPAPAMDAARHQALAQLLLHATPLQSAPAPQPPKAKRRAVPQRSAPALQWCPQQAF